MCGISGTGHICLGNRCYFWLWASLSRYQLAEVQWALLGQVGPSQALGGPAQAVCRVLVVGG